MNTLYGKKQSRIPVFVGIVVIGIIGFVLYFSREIPTRTLTTDIEHAAVNTKPVKDGYVGSSPDTSKQSDILEALIRPDAGEDTTDEHEEGYVREDGVLFGDIQVLAPRSGDTLSSPFVVTGNARAPEGLVGIRVVNPAGDVMIQETANVRGVGSDGFGTFTVTLHYQFSSTKDGFVEVFIGNDEHVAKVPVIFN